MPDRRPAVWLDHVVVGADDLDAGVSAFEELTGVRPVYGGAHPTMGTHNALVALGSGRYLEILAPRPGASLHPLVRDVGESDTLTPCLWALATDDLIALHRVVSDAGCSADEPSPGSRVTNEGETLRWSMFTMGHESPANAPFFIQWEPGTQHPSVSSPRGCSLGAFTVASVDHEKLQLLLTAVGFSTSVVAGSTRTVIVLATPRGTATLGG